MTRPDRRLPLLMALLLFALQGVALAHETTHVPGTDARDCVVCSVTAQPSAPPPDTGAFAAIDGESVRDPVRAPAALPRTPHRSIEARAPPLPTIR